MGKRKLQAKRISTWHFSLCTTQTEGDERYENTRKAKIRIEKSTEEASIREGVVVEVIRTRVKRGHHSPVLGIPILSQQALQ